MGLGVVYPDVDAALGPLWDSTPTGTSLVISHSDFDAAVRALYANGYVVSTDPGVLTQQAYDIAAQVAPKIANNLSVGETYRFSIMPAGSTPVNTDNASIPWRRPNVAIPVSAVLTDLYGRPYIAHPDPVPSANSGDGKKWIIIAIGVGLFGVAAFILLKRR